MGTSLIPWICWHFQYKKKLPEKVRLAKEKSFSSYVDQYFSLITSDAGGYTVFKNYTIVSSPLVLIGESQGVYEYIFKSFLQPPSKKAPLHILVNNVPKVAKIIAEPEKMAAFNKLVSPGLMADTHQPPELFSLTVGSGGSGTPPPPPKPGG